MGVNFVLRGTNKIEKKERIQRNSYQLECAIQFIKQFGKSKRENTLEAEISYHIYTRCNVYLLHKSHELSQKVPLI